MTFKVCPDCGGAYFRHERYIHKMVTAVGYVGQEVNHMVCQNPDCRKIIDTNPKIIKR